MRKNTLNFLVDLTTLVLFLGMATTGLLMEFVLPPGSGGKTLWGLGRHAWGDVHFWLAAGMVLLVIIHMALHWSWTVCTLRRLNPWRRGAVRRGPRDTVWGVATLVIIALALGAVVAVARTRVAPAVPGADEEHGEHAAGTAVTPEVWLAE